MTRRLSTKCGKAVVNSTTCGLKERGVASQKVQDGEAVLRVNLVRRLGQKNMLGNIEWLGRRLGLKCIVIINIFIFAALHDGSREIRL